MASHGTERRVRDLGALDGDVLVFGGVHSNLHALDAFLSQRAGRAAVCTGDVVAYCADAEACLRRLRADGLPSIAGNCERQLAARAASCGCGFDPGSTCDRLSGAWYAHASAEVSHAARAWMADLPDVLIFVAHGRRYAVLHGGISDIARFVWPSDIDAMSHEIRLLQGILDAHGMAQVEAVVAGHCGIAFCAEVSGIAWINAGSLGMPPHDGGSRTRFVRLTAQGPRIERLRYDWRGAQAAMRAAGLSQGYDVALETGYWPSEEILPDALRRSASG